jgi:4-amino-4-deoxy-L-arabinose transferase-like glycosyltransferase
MKKILSLLLLLALIGSFATLTSFPFMHSDESWLALLSQEMLRSGSLAASHPFFDLYPMYPHAIKVVFNLLQMAFIGLFGTTLFSMRLLSFVASTLALGLFYRLLKHRYDATTSLATILLLVLNVQWLHASHMARQESVLLVFLIGAWLLIDTKELKRSRLIASGALIGLAIGVHPNAFLLFTGLFAILGLSRKNPVKSWFTWGLPIGLFALFFVLWSLQMDPEFFTHFFSFGSTLGVDRGLMTKIDGLDDYLYKLYHAISGTYFVPRQKVLFWFFGGLVLWAIISSFKNRELRAPLAGLLGTLVGLVLIGRYNQTSLIFFYPYLYVLLAGLLHALSQRKKTAAIAVVGLLFLAISLHNLALLRPFDYPAFESFLAREVDEGPVLTNLSTGFALSELSFYDVRNLDHLERQGLTFAEYVEARDIRTVVLFEEMHVFYQKRPLYNALYGNLYPYYEEMMDYLSAHGRITAEMDTRFAMRVVDLALKRPYRVTVYRLEKTDE